MFTSIILAADTSASMKSEIPDALHKICGKPLCGWVIDEAKKAGADNIVVVTGQNTELFKEALGDEYEYAVQMPDIQGGCTVVLDGRAPLITAEMIKSMADVNSPESDDEIMVITDRVKLSEAEAIMRKRIIEMHMRNGVTIRIPDSVYIESGVEIGSDTEICPNVTLKAGTKIGKNSVIGTGSVLEKAVIHDNVDILSSVIIDSEVGSDTHVGPFAYIRPNCKVGRDVKVGDFVELKNSTIDDSTKISHLTYIGDSDVGKGVNFGCGTVTVNYDGKKKYRSTIGDHAFVGCNTNLVSPVNVGEGAYIAAGSTITDDIPSDNLAIARARQVNKQVSEEWLSKRRK